jgi:hypothetical protein
LTNQLCTSSSLGGSIEHFPTRQNLRFQGGRDISIPFDPVTCPNEDILRNSQTPHTASGLEFIIGERVSARRQDDEKIDVAVVTRRTPGSGAKEDDLFRLEVGDQTLGHLLQQLIRYPSHGFLARKTLSIPE